MMAEAGTRQTILAGRWVYDTEDRLPSGPNARTYGGVDLTTGSEIVVKIFSDSIDSRGRERFQREARLHESLDHEAILRLLDHGTDEGEDFIVTRRLRPGSLWNVLREGAPLPVATVQAIGMRIADALAYMHGRDEVHGDISPGNILLDGAEDAYLADFGFSKRLKTMPIASSGDAYGTEGFRAPRELGTARTYEDDVYSLAAVLWFCLTGNTPARWAKARRRELSSRTLRAPLEQALRWDDEQVPLAADFGAGLDRGWSKVARDWRVQPSRAQRSMVPGLFVAGLLGLTLALLMGQVFKPNLPHEAKTLVSGHGVTLRLDGSWRRKEPPRLPEFRFRFPVAAASGRTTIVAGRAPVAAAALIPPSARRTLPVSARRGRPVLVGDRHALSYGPANQFGGAVEVLAMPLRSAVLVVRCGGPAATLRRICAQVGADLVLREGSIEPLAPDEEVGQQIESAARRLIEIRRQARSELAGATKRTKLSEAASRLAAINERFAREIGALPRNAQDLEALRAVEESGQRLAAGYEGLAAAATAAAWTSARTTVARRERSLEDEFERLRALRIYPAGGRDSSS